MSTAFQMPGQSSLLPIGQSVRIIAQGWGKKGLANHFFARRSSLSTHGLGSYIYDYRTPRELGFEARYNLGSDLQPLQLKFFVIRRATPDLHSAFGLRPPDTSVATTPRSKGSDISPMPPAVDSRKKCDGGRHCQDSVWFLTFLYSLVFHCVSHISYYLNVFGSVKLVISPFIPNSKSHSCMNRFKLGLSPPNSQEGKGMILPYMILWNITCKILVSGMDEDSLSQQDIPPRNWPTWSRGYALGQAKLLTGIEHI